ncbi:Sodium channel protein Nach [Eumeta japonica]|uniref:Sodium channel protein Nach n=1 Tax=Eumeta variegata TaxID=151549 RepID=A0A4C1Z5L8_EUMVA|nr:Sodium channel protein Nach [Eumeta japonica]
MQSTWPCPPMWSRPHGIDIIPLNPIGGVIRTQPGEYGDVEKRKCEKSMISKSFQSVSKSFDEFCSQTSIQGFSHIAAPGRHLAERVLWAVLVALGVYGAIAVSRDQWLRYQDNPTVVTLDKDFINWNYSFPGITVCLEIDFAVSTDTPVLSTSVPVSLPSPIQYSRPRSVCGHGLALGVADVANKTDPEKAAQAIRKLWHVERNDSRYLYYARFVQTVANCDLTSLEAFRSYAEDEDLDVDLFELAKEVLPNFPLKVTWSGVSQNWTRVSTELGLCYSANCLALTDITIDEVAAESSPQLVTCRHSSKCSIALEMASPIKVICITVKAKWKLHRVFKCYVTLIGIRDKSPDGLFQATSRPRSQRSRLLFCAASVMLTASRDRRDVKSASDAFLVLCSTTELFRESSKFIQVYVHSPFDVPDLADEPSSMEQKVRRLVDLGVTETASGAGVRQLSVRRRRCKYNDEPTEPAYRAYSAALCARACRNRLAIRLCGCKPFLNFYEEGRPCSVKGMVCLSEHVAQLRAQATCACASLCRHATYKEISISDSSLKYSTFTKTGTLIYTVQAPRTRYTREIVFHFQDLVVSFGGAVGLFIGASFLSFVEVIYFFVERCVRVFGRRETQKRTIAKVSRLIPSQNWMRGRRPCCYRKCIRHSTVATASGDLIRDGLCAGADADFTERPGESTTGPLLVSLIGKPPAELLYRRQFRDKLPSVVDVEFANVDLETRDRDVDKETSGKEHEDRKRHAADLLLELEKSILEKYDKGEEVIYYV